MGLVGRILLLGVGLAALSVAALPAFAVAGDAGGGCSCEQRAACGE